MSLTSIIMNKIKREENIALMVIFYFSLTVANAYTFELK